MTEHVIPPHAPLTTVRRTNDHEHQPHHDTLRHPDHCCRRPGNQVAQDITSTTGNDKVRVAPLDLSDQQSVCDFMADWRGPLHILVNNAGIMATPEAHTVEGWEMQFATNHLGHFALTTGLHDALRDAGGARVVVEAAHRWAPDRIAVNALNPGRIASTRLGRHLVTPPASFDPSGSTGVSAKNIEQGAATSTLLAASPLVEGDTGKTSAR